MKESDIKVYAQRNPLWGKVEIWMRSETEIVGKPSIRKFTEADEGMCLDPTFRFDMHQAQQLMDELWTCGLRPTEGSGSAGAMAATQRHLEDMRTLVFKNLSQPSA